MPAEPPEVSAGGLSYYPSRLCSARIPQEAAGIMAKQVASSAFLEGKRYTQPPFGFIITDALLNPLHVNSEVVSMLGLSPDSVAESIKQRLAELVKQFDLRSPSVMVFTLEGMRYNCQTFPLYTPPDANSTGGWQFTVGFLFTPSYRSEADLDQVARCYRLSPREQVSLKLLMDGLVSKEIAERMKVSPNTVKSFLRMVMSKMGVSTRTELMRKILGIACLSVTAPAGEEQQIIQLQRAGRDARASR